MKTLALILSVVFVVAIVFNLVSYLFDEILHSKKAN